MKPINLKVIILLPLTIVSVLILVVFIVGVYHEEKSYLNQDLARSIETIEGHYHALLNERGHKLGAALEVIVADSTVKTALATKNRNVLLDWATPVFQRLKNEYNITHFYFHDNRRVNILRVHQPSRFGDTINRFTAIRAEKSNELSYGVELGPLGTFTLRTVLPVLINGVLLGYIELGEEVENIIQGIENVFAVNLAVFIEKKYLNYAQWQSGMSMLGRDVQWNRFSEFVVVSRTKGMSLNGMQDALEIQLKDNSQLFVDINVTNDEQHYRGRILRLRDAGNRIVGGMVVLRNLTVQIHNTNFIVALISISAMVLGILLFLLFFFILQRTENQLRLLFFGLRESQLHLSNAQRMAHLGNWHWDLQNKHIRYSDEACRIIGIETCDRPYEYSDLTACIHPMDRSEFQIFIDNVKNNGKTFEVVHRINRPDGSQRTVRQRAEVECSITGEQLCINAIIHDITELQHAEMRLVSMGRILAHSWNEIYTFDAKSLKFVEVSEGACKNLGYSMEELLKRTPLDLQTDYTDNQYAALITPLRTGEKQFINFESVHYRKNGSSYPVEMSLQLSGTELSSVFIGIAQDISERKRYIQELEHKAMYDALTELPNRSLLQDRLDHALKVARRETSSLIVIVVDVIRLREINDLLGHHNGDFVLKEVAVRLQKRLRESDTVARLGGDEFVIVLPKMDLEQVIFAVEKIQKLFLQPVVVGETQLELEVAIGIAHYPNHGDNHAILIQHADIAMRIAKNETCGYSVFNPRDDLFTVRRLKLHGELRNAITNKLLEVYYQPKINIKTGTVTSVEALARWSHETEGMISPVDFIPMVEQSGMIRPFTLWVLEQAIKQQKNWVIAGINLTVGVNLSTRNLLDPGLYDSILQLLETYDASPQNLILEITESAVMSRPEHALKVLTRLHDLGIKISIDDFGTGYSSLAYLKQLPVVELKIDYSFVSGILTNDSDAVIVRSTIDLAHNLGMSVVAEGIENAETLNELAILQCDTGQGFYFSRPQPAAKLTHWLKHSSWGVKSTKRSIMLSE